MNTAPCGFQPPPEGSVETHKRVCKLCENIELRERLGKALAVLSELASFEYKGGGYYRKKGVPRGESAEVLHGSQIQERIEEVLEEIDG